MAEIIIPDGVRYHLYAASVGQLAFAYAFPILTAADLGVKRLRAGVSTRLVLDTDYTVSGAGTQPGGTVTLTAEAQAGDLYALFGDETGERITDFVGETLTAADLNAELDRVVAGAARLEAHHRPPPRRRRNRRRLRRPDHSERRRPRQQGARLLLDRCARGQVLDRHRDIRVGRCRAALGGARRRRRPGARYRRQSLVESLRQLGGDRDEPARSDGPGRLDRHHP